MLSGSLGEIGIDQRRQGVDRLLLVCAVRHEGDRRALDDAERQNTEKALGVHASLVFFDPDAALELICLLDEESRGPCMESHLVVDDCFFRTEFLSNSVTADSYSLSDYVPVDVLRSYRIAL